MPHVVNPQLAFALGCRAVVGRWAYFTIPAPSSSQRLSRAARQTLPSNHYTVGQDKIPLDPALLSSTGPECPCNLIHNFCGYHYAPATPEHIPPDRLSLHSIPHVDADSTLFSSPPCCRYRVRLGASRLYDANRVLPSLPSSSAC